MSTLQLTATSATVNTLNFYITGQSAFSTGTFRYSTLTALTALPNTSLLYFNNFVVAGAYVWPGQLIKALGWEYALDGSSSAVAGVGTTIGNVQIGNTFGASAATFTNYYVASNVTGGTPPYTFLDGDGTGVASNALSNFGLSISNNYTGFPQFFGLIAGTITNYGSQNLFKVRLTDSTSPIPMVRNISFTFNTFAV